ncbi:Eco57I restriction-modification methylase domain-containing protein [Caloramator australicus]|uniref:site-specific DNA-methyltransferase (adenine-specific) n=1 Tax=Caloramator australicus RC3 TaxID=857293 RepID=I7J634_9CLOT|nr:N-6 DNA methylase [Caloramator australicus]CCJ34242.1 Modification methylase bstVI [Caloramator australicus RC3]
MLKEFLDDLDKAYQSLINGIIDLSIFDKWGESLGDTYQRLKNKEEKKKMGSVYTPYEVIKYMVDSSLSFEDYRKNPNLKILDPSCGGGFFLIYVYEKLLGYAEKLNIKNAKEHVVNNNIYGMDLDDVALKITILEVYKRSRIMPKNIVCGDFLFDVQDEFDVIIGNPPYMGHKVLLKDYRERLRENFGDVFYDKGDLSYCFIKKSLESLMDGGKLIFFISRYLLEAQHASGIRNFILNNSSIEKIIDFYGIRVFKNAGIDNIIIYLIKAERKTIEYFKFLPDSKKNIDDIFDDIDKKTSLYTKRVEILKDELSNDGWIFLNSLGKSIIKKIKGVNLYEIAECFQGIITGCDDAFVLTWEEAKKLKIEDKLLKPWIKGKNIEKFKIINPDKCLIYSNLIDDEKGYRNALMHIEKYKEKLIKRRECQKGVRRWYELQWGRSMDLFEGKKIIFPYKAASNKFAIDFGSYFSADVYGLKLLGLYESLYSYEFLVGILNSSIYEFYIKTHLKKLGDNLYEYYPYNLLRIKIPEYIKDVENEVLKYGNANIKIIDKILKEYFKITDKEFNEVKFWLSG